MYLPSHFTETDRAEIAALIDARPLAALVVATNRGLVANHIPLLRDGDGLLVGHIAIANELHRLVPDGHEVLGDRDKPDLARRMRDLSDARYDSDQ